MIVVDDVDGENGEETDPRGVLPGGVDLNSELTADEQLALTSKAKETPSRRGEDTATDQTGRDSRRRDDDSKWPRRICAILLNHLDHLPKSQGTKSCD